MSEEYDYYQVGVAKRSYVDVYIKVPKGDSVSFKDRALVREATVETIHKLDWDDYGWENDLEIEGIVRVDGEDLVGYKVYDAKELE